MDQVHGVVHGGPWTGSMRLSMDPGPCFVYVPELLKSPGSKTDNYCEIKLVIFNTPGISSTFHFQCLFELI